MLSPFFRFPNVFLQHRVKQGFFVGFLGGGAKRPPAQGFVAISDPRSERVKLGTARNYSIFPTVVHNENLPPEILDKSFLNMSDLVSFC